MGNNGRSPLLIDMTGWRFGRLKVVRQKGNLPGGQPVWHCHCDCGREHDVTSGNLRNGGTKSCGCLYDETRGIAASKHGLCEHSAYISWLAMLEKCYNPDDPGWPSWGGRGIGVVEEWRGALGIIQFVEDMGERPKGHALGVIDVYDDFGPFNCEWVPHGHWYRKKRWLNPITWDGRTQGLLLWAEELGIAYKTLKWRIAHWGNDWERIMNPAPGGGQE